MKGIKLAYGTIFVTDGVSTVRVSKNGECDVSPISYSSLEWDLRTENPNSWEYIGEWELKSLPGGVYEKVLSVFEHIRDTLGE